MPLKGEGLPVPGRNLQPEKPRQRVMSSTTISMPIWDEKHLRAATRAAGVALWSWNVDTDAITMCERAYNLWEVSKDEKNITLEICLRIFTPLTLSG